MEEGQQKLTSFLEGGLGEVGGGDAQDTLIAKPAGPRLASPPNPSRGSTKVATRSATLPVLRSILDGFTTMPALAQHLKRDKSRISRIVKKCIERGLIAKIGKSPAVLDVTGAGRVFLRKVATFSPGVEVATLQQNVPNGLSAHALKYKFIVLSDAGSFVWPSVNEKFRNGLQAYLKVQVPFEVTLERTSKSVLVGFRKSFARGLFQAQAVSYSLKVIYFAYHFLRQRGIVIDLASVQTSQLHVADEAKEYEAKVDPHTTHYTRLGRTALGLAGPLGKGAAVWIDRSHGPLEVETNDVEYAVKLELMPEKVFDLEARQARFESNLDAYNKSLEWYDANMKTHKALLEEMRDTLKAIRDSLAKKEGV